MIEKIPSLDKNVNGQSFKDFLKAVAEEIPQGDKKGLLVKKDFIRDVKRLIETAKQYAGIKARLDKGMKDLQEEKRLHPYLEPQEAQSLGRGPSMDNAILRPTLKELYGNYLRCAESYYKSSGKELPGFNILFDEEGGIRKELLENGKVNPDNLNDDQKKEIDDWAMRMMIEKEQNKAYPYEETLRNIDKAWDEVSGRKEGRLEEKK